MVGTLYYTLSFYAHYVPILRSLPLISPSPFLVSLLLSFFLLLSPLSPFHVCRMMEQSLSGEIMKTQDLPDVVVAVSRNPHGYKLAWDFLRANWHTMIKKSVSTGMQRLHIHALIFKRSVFTKCAFFGLLPYKRDSELVPLHF